jgi:hypothetical protein
LIKVVNRLWNSVASVVARPHEPVMAVHSRVMKVTMKSKGFMVR